MEAKDEIETLRESADTPEKQQALQQKVVILKADIAKYEEQSNALKEEVNAFNAAVKSGNPAQPQTQ